MAHRSPPHYEDPLARADLLVPLTLVNTDDAEFYALGELMVLRRRRDGATGTERQRLADRVSQVVDELTPVGDNGKLYLAGEVFEDPFLASRDQRQRKDHFVPWRKLLAGRLRWVVAARALINGRPADEETLRLEKEELALLLDAMIAFNLDANDRQDRAKEVERLLSNRLGPLRATEQLRPGIDTQADRIRLLAFPAPDDIGALNTQRLLDLFALHPVSSLRRCKFGGCRRVFVPGAEGRKRTRSVRFCSDPCKRAWLNANRTAS
jgi:hypothetical protein